MSTDQGGTEGLLDVVSTSAEIYSHNKGNVWGVLNALPSSTEARAWALVASAN